MWRGRDMAKMSQVPNSHAGWQREIALFVHLRGFGTGPEGSSVAVSRASRASSRDSHRELKLPADGVFLARRSITALRALITLRPAKIKVCSPRPEYVVNVRRVAGGHDLLFVQLSPLARRRSIDEECEVLESRFLPALRRLATAAHLERGGH